MGVVLAEVQLAVARLLAKVQLDRSARLQLFLRCLCLCLNIEVLSRQRGQIKCWEDWGRTAGGGGKPEGVGGTLLLISCGVLCSTIEVNKSLFTYTC